VSNALVSPLLNQRKPLLSPCPVCHGTCEVKITKKGKPYVICDPCGVQLFVRGKGGIQRFETQNAALEKVGETLSASVSQVR